MQAPVAYEHGVGLDERAREHHAHRTLARVRAEVDISITMGGDRMHHRVVFHQSAIPERGRYSTRERTRYFAWTSNFGFVPRAQERETFGRVREVIRARQGRRERMVGRGG